MLNKKKKKYVLKSEMKWASLLLNKNKQEGG